MKGRPSGFDPPEKPRTSASTDTGSTGPSLLRADLEVIDGRDPSDRFRVIACNISGKFTRISSAAWQALQRGHGDADLQTSAMQAGWTRQRVSRRSQGFSWLAIQIPLFNVDPLARWLRDRTDWLFSNQAVKAWLVVFLIAWMLMISRWDRLRSDLTILPEYLSAAHPLILFVTFVSTKLAHELGHAVMCRRVGARCGQIGLYLFCGFPCPYCDVTQVWRQPSSLARMGVMSAGIYVEWVIASLGVFLWCWSDELAVRLLALNVILLCGISTFLFNANPLMRYDGYYVLADWLGSVDLRAEARRTFAKQFVSCLGSPVALWRALRPNRQLLLATYSIASVAYRAFVMVAIAGVLLWVTERIGFRIAGRVLVGVIVVASVVSVRIRVLRFLRGASPWQELPPIKRWVVFLVGAVGLALFVLAPLPRFRTATGVLDAAEFSVVYLPPNSRLVATEVDFGTSVGEGEPIATTEDLSLRHRLVQSKARHQLASMQTRFAKRETLLERAGDRDWLTYESAERAAFESQRDLTDRFRQLQVVAPSSGIIIPPKPMLHPADVNAVRQTSLEIDDTLSRDGTGVRTLADTVGSVIASGKSWCRVGTPSKMVAVIQMDALTRGELAPGQPVRLAIAAHPGVLWMGSIRSIAESDTQAKEPWEAGTFEVTCEITDSERLDVLADLGCECKAVFDLPSRSLYQSSLEWMAGLIHE